MASRKPRPTAPGHGKPPPLNACTIVSCNYIAFARVLARSFLEHQPEGRFFVLLVDRNEGRIDPAAEPFELLEIEELENVPDLPGFLFKYTLLECNTAVKPFVLEHLVAEHQLPNLVYFDPDILITGSLEHLRSLVAEHSIVVTPHLTDPIDDDAYPGEQAILQSGTYNLGFIALRADETSRRLLRWWQDRLYDRCLVRIEEGLFVDQKWIDLAPGLFPDLFVLADPGYNAAYWNLHGRTIEASEGSPEEGWTSNGRPLVFFHFSGIEPGNLHRVSKHQNRFTLGEIGRAADLYQLYSDRVLAAGHREASPWSYAFARFDNGARIPAAARTLYHQLAPETRAAFGNPFETAPESSFFRWLNAPAPGAPRRPPHATRLLVHLHGQRADLVGSFPRVTGKDFPAFCSWLADYGRHELGLDEAFLTTLHRESRATLLTADGLERRLRNRAKRFYHSSAGRRCRQLLTDTLGRERSQRLRQKLRPPKPGPAPSPTGRRLPLPRSIEVPGINLVGYLQAETGMGEVARGLARSLEAAGVPVSLHSLDLNVLARSADRSFAPATSSFPYGINLLAVNADQVGPAVEHLGADLFAGRYNVGYWLWELDVFPEAWRSAFDPLQEVWTPSTFCVDAFSSLSPVPVRRVPIPVEAPAEIDPGRERFEVPASTFTVLYMFNYLSYFERKNPLAAIRAFRRAFEPDDDALLLLKTSQSDFGGEAQERIEAEIGDANVRLLDGYLDRDEIWSLIDACDTYLSLHRSEGFGLTLAEAMALGKPVVATAYSGNVDFFDLNRGLPVRYDLVELTADAGPYPKGARWADPHPEHAARQLRRLYEHREEGAAIGERARSYLEAELSYAAVGEVLARRYAEILRRVEGEVGPGPFVT